MLQGEDERLGSHHRSSSYDYARTYYILFDGFELRTVADCLLYQIRAEPFIAGVFAAQTQEWNVGIYQHLADFIYGSVGIAHQEDGGCRLLSRLASSGDAFCCWHSRSVVQCFFYHKLQGTTGFSCSWRSYEQEVILCLFGTEDDIVQDIVVMSGQCQRSISLRSTLSQQQVAFLLWRTDKLVQVADASTGRCIARSVLYCIRQVHLEDVGILLSVSEMHYNLMTVNLLQYTFI